MDSRQPELSRLTLMCSDHEVAEFTWNHDRQAVTGKTHVLDAAHAPLMATDPSGNITRDRLSSWFKNRGIPDFRPDAADRLRAVGYPSAASLMASGFGASLSDQYWIRPAGSASTWRDVNCFENDFSEELGELLLPHDASSVPSLIEKIRGNADLLASSPDAALNGNLPKRWTIEGGQRMLVKSGRSSGRFQEPFNEKIASVLCSRLLDEGDYVAYELEDGGFMKWTSRCKPMTDQVTEFVPAWALLCSSKRPSDLGLHDFYVSACAAHGLPGRLPGRPAGNRTVPQRRADGGPCGRARPRRPRRGRGQGAARRGQRQGRGARRKARVARRAPAGDRRDAVVASRPHGHEAARPRGRIAGAPRPIEGAAGLFGFHRGGRFRTGTRACRRSRPRPRRSTGWRGPRNHPGCRRGRPPRRAAGAAPRG